MPLRSEGYRIRRGAREQPQQIQGVFHRMICPNCGKNISVEQDICRERREAESVLAVRLFETFGKGHCIKKPIRMNTDR